MGEAIFYSPTQECLKRAVVTSVKSRAERLAVEAFVEALPACGLALVPMEPTDDMKRIAATYLGFYPNESRERTQALRLSMWRAMIAAADAELKRRPAPFGEREE